VSYPGSRPHRGVLGQGRVEVADGVIPAGERRREYPERPRDGTGRELVCVRRVQVRERGKKVIQNCRGTDVLELVRGVREEAEREEELVVSLDRREIVGREFMKQLSARSGCPRSA
jgi:hypothetical protein